MSSPARPSMTGYVLWLSLVIAAILAFMLPTAWIAYSDRATHTPNFLNFHPLMAVLYVPLAFGVIWPVLIAVASWAMGSPSRPRKWPRKTAIIMFAVSACCAAPFIILEHRNLVRRLEAARAESSRVVQFRQQQEMEKERALATLEANGITSLTEPLTGPQVDAVNSYLDAHSDSADELLSASRHYRTTVGILSHLSDKRYCPPEVLEIVFDDVVDLQKDPHLPDPGNLYEVLYNLAWNPNVPVPVLVRMLDDDAPNVRRAAAANPRLPKAARIAYLKRAPASGSFSEREAAAGDPDSPPDQLAKMLEDDNFRVREAASLNPNTPKAQKILYLQKSAASGRLWDRILAAQDPDCPPEQLKKLASDPATARYVASNPGCPTDLLQTLAQSEDPETCRRAVANLTKRQKTEH